MKFDELNQLKRFFSEMDLTDDEKKKRTNLAYSLYDAVYFTFALIKVEKEIEERDFARNELIVSQYRETLENRITDALNREGVPYEDEYITRVVTDILDTTNRHLDDPYYLSQERALLIAQNESNTAYNHADYETARKSGKQYKVWMTEGDNLVRLEHEEVDGVRVPIDEMFIVGSDLMRYPHDYINGSPGNLINCRCICLYE